MARVYSSLLFQELSDASTEWTQAPAAGYLWVIREMAVYMVEDTFPISMQLLLGFNPTAQFQMVGGGDYTFQWQGRLVVPATTTINSLTSTAGTGSVITTAYGYTLTTP